MSIAAIANRSAPIAGTFRAILCVITMFGLFTGQPASAGDAESWDRLSTGLTLGLAGVAVTATLAKSDTTGLKQGLATTGATLLTVEALKALVGEQRPDGSDDKSFPSGHTALAFAAATYLDVRYGQEYPGFVPVAYGLAALTGLARVKADKHYVQDVVAGAAIGWGMAHVFTTRPDEQFFAIPSKDGMMFAYTRHF